MSMPRLVLSACLFASAWMLGPAVGQTAPIVSRMTPDEVLDFLHANKVEARHHPGPTNEPTVQAVLGGMRGAVILKDCEEKRCGSLKFVVSGKADARHTPDYLNDWNARRRYVPAYLFDGTVFLTRDFNLSGGVTTAALVQELRVFDTLVRGFGSFKP